MTAAARVKMLMESKLAEKAARAHATAVADEGTRVWRVGKEPSE